MPPPALLDILPLDDSQRQKLWRYRGLDAAGLLGVINAAPDAFGRYFGPAETDALLRALRAVDPNAESIGAGAARSVGRAFPLGAMIGAAPADAEPGLDIAKRDALFDKIERLRNGPGGTAAHQDEIRRLERELERVVLGVRG